MKAVWLVLLLAPLGCVATVGQGFFVFNNRVPPEINARYALCTDAPGTSSVTGPDYHVQLLFGPPSVAFDPLTALGSADTDFRNGVAAGYVNPLTVMVPGMDAGTTATVLVRAFKGATWETSQARVEKAYPVFLLTATSSPHKVIETLEHPTTQTGIMSDPQFRGQSTVKGIGSERPNATPARITFLGYVQEDGRRLARLELKNNGDPFSQYSGPYIDCWDGSRWTEFRFEIPPMALLGRSKHFHPPEIVTVPVPSSPGRWRARIEVEGRSSGNYTAYSAEIVQDPLAQPLRE